MKNIVILLLSLAFISNLQAQKKTELLLRKKTFTVDSSRILIDSFSIQDDFFILKNDKNVLIPKQEYEVDFSSALLKFRNYKKYLNQKLSVYYLTYPSSLKKPIYSYTRPQKENEDSLLLPVIGNKVVYQPRPLEGLKTSGNITRGVSTGNNQSLVMQSGMELKIEGKLSDKINLKAVISDDNMPQAYAGISKSFKEFNYVYMELSSKKWKALGGDFLIKQRPSYFLKFDRKLQGLKVETSGKSKTSVTGGIIEGIFNRQQFNGIDGNQGPYLLKGKNGEKYIFIIKDSEKVYINGKLLKKEEDYKIDYELAEISFVPSLPISSNDRISVEFNYANQYYLRYFNYNSWQRKMKKGQVEVYTFLEKDSKYHSLLFDLDSVAIDKLRKAGDNPKDLVIESAKLTTYSPNKIVYKKINNGTDVYYEFTNENLPELYEVRFSYLGKNKGDYNIKSVTAIGKIYEYIGHGNGEYSPVIKLVPPVSKKYAGIKWNHQLGKNTFIYHDFLISQTDKNLFSTKDDQDNIGMGSKIEITHVLQKDSLHQWDMYGKYHFVHQNFEVLEPYIDPEFTYQWQIDDLYGKQHFIQAGSHYTSENLFINGGAEYLNLRDTIEAYKIFLEGKKRFKKVEWRGSNMLVSQKLPEGSLTKTWFDNEMGILLRQSKWTNHIHVEKREKTTYTIPDSLNFGYRYFESKWATNEDPENELQMGLRIARNDSLQQGQYQKARSDFMLFLQKKIKYKAGKLFFYGRWQQINSSHLSKKTLYNFSFHWEQDWAKKWIQSRLKIETYNGNILRDEMIFVETPPGQGVYQWNDYNQNGIKEINEFEIAVFSDQARYIKVMLPSKNYLPVNNNLYSVQFVFNPIKTAKNRYWNILYNRLLLETNHRTPLENKQVFFEWNPHNSLLKNTHIQNDFYINRTKKKYRLHTLYQHVQNEQLLIIGKQALLNERWKIETSHQFDSQLLWEQSYGISQLDQASENYAEKNFKIKSKSLEQAFSILKMKQYQWKVFYQWKNKKSLAGEENLKTNSLGLNYYVFPTTKYSFFAQLKFVYNKFDGNPYTPTAFYMLEGLQKGKNLLSEINYKTKLKTYLELLFSYQFRISEENTGIHTAGVQLRMSF